MQVRYKNMKSAASYDGAMAMLSKDSSFKYKNKHKKALGCQILRNNTKPSYAV